MDPAHLQELIAREPTYWWHVAKRRLVLDWAAKLYPPPGRLAEGGVGAGGTLVAFRQQGYEVAALDLSPDSIQHCRQLGITNAWVHDLQAPWPIEPGTCRLVVLLDVIEHLPDPVQALSHAKSALAPGGGIIVAVPAYPWLFGPWDRMLGHQRRYTRGRLKSDAAAAGLRVAGLSHWNSFSLPPAIVARAIERLRGHSRSAEFPDVSPLVNRALLAAASVERAWMRRFPVPFGLSLIGALEP